MNNNAGRNSNNCFSSEAIKLHRIPLPYSNDTHSLVSTQLNSHMQFDDNTNTIDQLNYRLLNAAVWCNWKMIGIGIRRKWSILMINMIALLAPHIWIALELPEDMTF